MVLVAFLVSAALWAPLASGRTMMSYNLSGECPPTAYDFFFLPFAVPEGVAEIEVCLFVAFDWASAPRRRVFRAPVRAPKCAFCVMSSLCPACVAQVSHKSVGNPNDILDFGLNDSNGFRGWGGGNLENAVVGVNASSRSYMSGPMPAGGQALALFPLLVT